MQHIYACLLVHLNCKCICVAGYALVHAHTHIHRCGIKRLEWNASTQTTTNSEWKHIHRTAQWTKKNMFIFSFLIYRLFSVCFLPLSFISPSIFQPMHFTFISIRFIYIHKMLIRCFLFASCFFVFIKYK